MQVRVGLAENGLNGRPEPRGGGIEARHEDGKFRHHGLQASARARARG